MKTCSTCGRDKEHSEFYPKRGQCKECVLARCRAYYRSNLEERHEYDRKRSRRPERRKYRLESGKKDYEKHPVRVKARWMLNNWVRLGYVVRPDTCPRCGRSDVVVEGHHEDHSRPLDVEWACRTCHRRIEGRLVK